MYTLFTRTSELRSAAGSPQQLDSLKRVYRRGLQIVQSRHRQNVAYLATSHLLCKLILQCEAKPGLNVYDYAELMHSRAPVVERLNGLTSEISSGKVFNGVFYGEGSKEIVLACRTTPSIVDLENNWLNYESLKVLKHPQSDFNFALADGRSSSTAQGLSIFSVDLVAMMLQYRLYCNDALSKGVSAEALSIPNFVSQIVLPNALGSWLDLVIYNRTTNLFYGAPMSSRTGSVRIATSSFHSKLDSLILKVLEQLRDSGRHYFETLFLLPSAIASTQLTALEMPDIARTRQVWWALLLTRLQECKFLLMLQGDKGRRANGIYVGKLKTDLIRLGNENSLKGLLGQQWAQEVQIEIEEIRSLIDT